jgi:hypothetical protein
MVDPPSLIRLVGAAAAAAVAAFVQLFFRVYDGVSFSCNSNRSSLLLL